MKALQRALAAWLSLWLAGSPAASAAGFQQSPVRTVALPSAPVAPAVSLSALPSSALSRPGLAQAPAALPAAANGDRIGLAAALPPAAAAPAATLVDSPRGESRSQPAALPQLQSLGDPRRAPESLGAAFDGGGLQAAAPGDAPDAGAPAAGGTLSRSGSGAAPAPAPAPSPRPPAPAPKRPSWLKRLNAATGPQSRAEVWLERGVLLGVLAAAAAPVLWKAAPFHTLVMTLPVALAPLAVAFGALTFFRAARFVAGRAPAAPRAPPGRALARAAAAFGLALGLAFGAAPTVYHAPLVQAIESRISPKSHARLVPGDAVPREIAFLFSKNAVGRRILDDLKDRSGTLRLPVFLVREESDSLASHVAPYDAVFIGAGEIRGAGMTVEDFLADPAKQAQFVADNQSLFAHELTHAIQARRSIREPGQFGNTMEYEYEAYMAEHFFVHEQLKADPGTKAVLGELGSYEYRLDDLDGSLKELDTLTAYKNNLHIDSPRYRKWKADLRAGWPAHQLEGYALLVQRYEKVPALRDQFLKKARQVAAEHHLPLPPELAAKAPAKVK
jgi:hypothetical protein